MNINQVPAMTNESLIIFIVYEGNISCHAKGQYALLDSNLSCFLFQLPFFLETIGFGYICFPLIFAIIFISIFGKINENYKYFILNQAIWDLLVIYNFLCNKPSYSAWFDRYQEGAIYKEWLKSINEAPATCFYYISVINTESYIMHAIKTIFSFAAAYASYAPLFLLTLSRFMAVYFHYFHERFATPLKTLFTIIGFNLIFIAIVNIAEWVQLVQDYIFKINYKNCLNACNGSCNEEEQFKCDVSLEEYIMKYWPTWLRFISLEPTVQCFSVLRVFLDSLIILIVLTGYRENVIGFLKF